MVFIIQGRTPLTCTLARIHKNKLRCGSLSSIKVTGIISSLCEQMNSLLVSYWKFNFLAAASGGGVILLTVFNFLAAASGGEVILLTVLIVFWQ